MWSFGWLLWGNVLGARSAELCPRFGRQSVTWIVMMVVIMDCRNWLTVGICQPGKARNPIPAVALANLGCSMSRCGCWPNRNGNGAGKIEGLLFHYLRVVAREHKIDVYVKLQQAIRNQATTRDTVIMNRSILAVYVWMDFNRGNGLLLPLVAICCTFSLPLICL